MKTYKLMAFILEDGKNAMVEIDMIFKDGKPFAVFEYTSVTETEELPQQLIPLDPALLQKSTVPGWDYIYKGQLMPPNPEDN